MKTQAQQISERLKNIIQIDGVSSIENLLIVLKSDLAQLFSSYMYVQPQNIAVSAKQDEDGNFIFTTQIKTSHILDFGVMI
ncbi:MAG: hypothetical protein FWE22_07350 [Firmicutes bacterium]|nr:hypothetical protein [Bacillota bacterium]